MSENVKYQVLEESLFYPQQSENINLNEDLIQPQNESEEINASKVFENTVRNYVSTYKPNLVILTPCFGSVCYADYTASLLETVGLLRHFDIEVNVQFCKNDSLVSRARNNLIAKALYVKDTTHVMFIDNDIGWDPASILKLLIANKPIVAGIYPLKNYDWQKLLKDPLNPYNSNVIQSWITKKNNSQFKNFFDDEHMIQFNLLKYNVNYLNNYLEIENNLTKVKHAPTGFMMIQRNVIEKMIQAFPSTKYTDDVSFLKPEENEYAYALFDCGVEDNHYYSEDWLFCHRWQRMGGDVWIDVSINLTHTGIEVYKGCYMVNLI
jgi:hypothetical protein